MQGGANVKNLALVLFQLIKGRTANVERALQIDIYDGSEAVGRKLFRGTKKISCRTIDDNVDFTKSFDGSGDCFLNYLRVTNVGRDGEGFSDTFVSGTSL